MANFCDLYEIDEEDVTMHLFVQTFGGEVRKWFIGLAARSIPTLDELHKQFLDRWEIRKDPLQINAEYNNLKHNHGESIQDYIIRFNTVYNVILDDLKPSRKSALLKFPDGFYPKMDYSLQYRDPPTLDDTQKIAVSVEANFNDKRARMKAEKRVTIKEEASTSDQLLRKVKRMLEKVTLDKPEPQIHNPNFRGLQQPQYKIKQRETRTQDPTVQQLVKTLLQQNFFSQESEDEGDTVGEENHFISHDELPTYVTVSNIRARNCGELQHPPR